MTEDEWACCADPVWMLHWLGGRAGDRGLRLFAVACCRRIGHLFRSGWHDDALRAAERFADGAVTRADLRRGRVVSRPTPPHLIHHPTEALAAASHELRVDAPLAATHAAHAAADAEAGPTAAWRAAKAREQAVQAALVRDIFGNPFRPASADPAWLTRDVVSLAQGAYEERAFDRLPILADALMDAGCTDPHLLAHCRSEGPHVRGCWVVDLVLGKS